MFMCKPTTGRRIKEPHNPITWAHSILHKDGFNLKQCFFGGHLLPKDTKKSVAIVESEKTDLPQCRSWPELLDRLNREGITVEFKMKSGTNEPQGIKFCKNGYHFNGSKADQQFSFSKRSSRSTKSN